MRVHLDGVHDAVKVLFVFFANVLCLHPNFHPWAWGWSLKAWQFNGVFNCNNKPHYFPEVVFIKLYQLWFSWDCRTVAETPRSDRSNETSRVLLSSDSVHIWTTRILLWMQLFTSTCFCWFVETLIGEMRMDMIPLLNQAPTARPSVTIQLQMKLHVH